jgi:adenine-specific DNA-methyltransferase
MYRDNKLDSRSIDICSEKLEQLKTIFPEVFCEDEIDFDKLKLILGKLGNSVVSEKERFGLNWSGKADCFKIIQNPTAATLRPCRQQSINFDTTQNLFIEGDNLEVLKLLQRSYSNKVKMIYIDPPYNTGKDFIYPDDYTENLDTYLRYTEQKDEEGRRFATNTESDGRYHSKWLSMMYPRLYLAKSLLRDDGVIFVSIDDHEQAYLKVLMDQVFASVDCIIWQKMDARYDKNTNSKIINRYKEIHEYILIGYKKDKTQYLFNKIKKLPDWKNEQSNADNDKRGKYKQGIISFKEGHPHEDKSSEFYYSITLPSGRVLTRHFFITKDEFKKLQKDNRIYFPNNGDGIPALKVFENEEQEYKPDSILRGFGTTSKAKEEILELMYNRELFETPKPKKLISEIIRMTTNSSDIILDFFSGSSTTAHAVMKLNAEDGGNRKYIMVQLPEKCSEDSEAYKAGYKTIADIGKERIRRAAKKILEEHSDYKGDLGFKVFKLDSSNFKLWNNNTNSEEEYNRQLSLAVDNIKKGRSQEDILYDIILRLGLSLTDTIDVKNFGDKNVFSLRDGKILICLEKVITEQLIEEIIKYNPDKVIFLDIGFQGNDLLKIYAQDSFKNHISENKNKAIEFIVY